jgi:hypothetical protein
MNDMLAASRHVAGLTDEERAERARLAVKNFRAMQASLTGFARALTGNKKVRVELDTGTPRTDGERIFFRPPLALGVPGKHDRMLCEKRGDNSVLLCEACRVREEVLAPIYHEISHIAFDSFAPTLEQHKISLAQRAIDEWGTKYSAKIKERIDSLPARMKNDYMTMAGLISPFLPMLLNALEDARVNASMFRARPGVKVMMKSHVYGLLEDGVENEDGSTVMWRDQPLNAQVIAGCFVIGAGYDIESGWFHPDVADALLDDQLDDLCVRAGMARRAADVYEISFQVLARLRELGFCKNPEMDPEEEEEEPDAEPDDDGDSGDPDPESDPDSDADDAEDEGTDGSEGGDEAPAEEEGDKAGGEGEEAPAEEPEAGAGSDGDEEVDHAPEDSEAGGSAGSEVGDDDDLDAGEDGSGQSEQAEPEGSMDSEEEGVGGGESEPSTDGDDAGAERPDSGDEELADGEQSGTDHESSDVDGPDDGEVDSDEADESEGGGTNAGGEGEAGPADGDGEGDDSEDGAGQGDHGESSDLRPDERAEDFDEEGPRPEGEPGEVRDERSSDGPESPDASAEEGVQPEALDGHGVDDDPELEDQADKGGVSDSDPVPSRPEDAGESGEGTEDAERDADSAPSGEGGDGDGTEAEPVGNTDSSPAVGFDWAAEEEGRVDPESDPSGEPAEQQPAPDTEATTDPEDVDPEAFDMGGDEGQGGVKIEPEEERPEFGDPEDVEALMKLIENHTEPPKSLQADIKAADEAIDQAIIQGAYFETPSTEVWGVRIHAEGKPGLNDRGHPCDNAWNHERVHEADIDDVEAGIVCDLDVPESIMGKALLHTRRTFDANKTSKYEPNLKSGRVNSRVLGKRAWSGDQRLFGKKRVPGKRDYFVLIGVDVSGSTVGVNLALAKRAAMAQAELCQRAGVKFAVYAHTFNDRHGKPYEIPGQPVVLDIYEIKTADEPWDDQRRNRLATIGPDGGNLDGHTLEFYRKRLDEVQATDKIILYYTDGRMPASNYDEELEILQREIRTCKMKGYTLLGVGIRTDSPIRHGLDTVRVDNDENIKDVVAHLEKRLSDTR